MDHSLPNSKAEGSQVRWSTCISSSNGDRYITEAHAGGPNREVMQAASRSSCLMNAIIM